LGSIIPTSGGQYYWVAVLAPKSCRKYLSYVTGWLCATSWETGIASTAFLSGTIMQGLFILNLPNYNPKNWHGTLLVIAISVMAMIFNTILARRLPLIEGLLVILHLIGIVLVIPLWVYSPLRSDGTMFVDFYNGGGWSTTGVSAMVGMLSVIVSMSGLDCSVHMAEETKDSSRNLPISLLMGFFINAFLALFVIFTVIFTAGPLDQFLESKTGYPFIDLFFSATKSYAATNVMVSIMIINLTGSCIAVLATASRQLWSFARNKGVPFSAQLAPTVLPNDIPISALFVSLGITTVLALINIGSSAALNAIFSLGLSSLLTSYMFTIGSMIYWRLQGNPIPVGRFSLGRWGLGINIAAMCFLIPVYPFAFFPTTVNPTPQSMNWGILMYGAVIIFATVYYIIWGRHTYTPPTDEGFIGQEGLFVGSKPAEHVLESEQECVDVIPDKQLDI